jgi:putative Ca2+/H+ antiporter (TMEM165/GDT1 family)
MDLRLFASTFVTIFFVEFGDKTQLATLTLASQGHSRVAVFASATRALAANTAIGVVTGGSLMPAIPAPWMRRAVGILFTLLGLFYLLRD